MAPAIEVDGLWKQYRYGTLGYGTLRHDFQSWWARARGREDPNAPLRPDRRRPARGVDGRDRFWALEDVSFAIAPGEVVGLIGRNGAGKSTLLKILSRVTSPTRGTVRLMGRVASLLEVGTGFHPDLTGRENVYLNGAIMGMTRAEVRRKFDEVISFAELDQFVDTPVKRYSSGMYVRLAFSVAAHLEPEILLVDEVLAVGDAEFQAKCLGKMGDASRNGRTILFVSHNLQAIQSLCSRTLLIAGGQVAASGATEEVIESYLISFTTAEKTSHWKVGRDLGNGLARLLRVAVFPSDAAGPGPTGTELSHRTDRDLVVELVVFLETVPSGLCIGFDLERPNGAVVLRSYHTDLKAEAMPKLRVGENQLRCLIPAGLLNGGEYRVAPRVSIHNQEWLIHDEARVSFRAVLSHGESPFWNCLSENNRPGDTAPILAWEGSPSARRES